DLAAVAAESVETARPLAEGKEITLTLATSPPPLPPAARERPPQLPDNLAAAGPRGATPARPFAEEKEITWTLATSPLPLLAGDRARLAQLLDNLVSNAIKFTPEGGRVDVRASPARGHAR